MIGGRGERNKVLQFRFSVYATLVAVVLLLVLYMSSEVMDYLRVSAKSEIAEVCEHETSSRITSSEQHQEKQRPHDEVTARLKRQLYAEVLAFQRRRSGAETLPELLRMPSQWSFMKNTWTVPRVTVILNHFNFKRRTLCLQLARLPFHRLWVVSFGSPNEASLRRVVESQNDSRISFVSSDFNFRYYGRFQVALQSDGADYVYVLDDDMIPGTRMLEILCHVAGTKKYSNAGRILPFQREADLTFPSYRTMFRSMEAGLYLPYEPYKIVAERVVHDLHVSYMLHKYAGAGSFVVPVDSADTSTWGDTDHRLAYVAPTTATSAAMVRARDEQWWRALTSGYVTRWAEMRPQKVDALLCAPTLDDVRTLAPLLEKFRAAPGRKAYIVVSGGGRCTCEEAVKVLGWRKEVCTERRFSVFDLGVKDVPVLQAVYAGMRGIVRTHSPSVIVAVDGVDAQVKEALRMAAAAVNRTTLVLLPEPSVSKVLWMATLSPASLPNWNRMRISVNIITRQTRPESLLRLLASLRDAYYLGDEVPISFNMDSGATAATLRVINSFGQPHGPKTLRRRAIRGGLVRAVTECCSWGAVFFPEHWRELHTYMAKQNPVQISGCRTNGWHHSWNKFFIDMMYLRGYVSLYPNFPNQTSFSTNHMVVPGVHISASDQVLKYHDKLDFEVPLIDGDFVLLLPGGKMPPASKLSVIDLFNQDASLKGLKAAGAKLRQDVVECEAKAVIAVDHVTGMPTNCSVL
ncbi:hypothetical protein PR202_ga12451 [Eleusine coracana subsp. coracana]|uniref:Uncharacterized protein n=1 Tax=Eleusine coracana subsp. coracana TaxID=191504 RepID=A0AAV5CC46_ELECO|nr:hypothetical protein PR202_ga12451 [Eleusine coracana subsp. coracana]